MAIVDKMDIRRCAAISTGGLILAAAACCVGSPAFAQGQRATSDAGGATLFISPMGEPFRAESVGPAPIMLWIAAADDDGDGALSELEFVAQALAFLSDRLDRNGDAIATSFESNALWSVDAPEMLTSSAPLPSVEEAAALIAARRGTNGGRRRGGSDGEIPDDVRRAIERALEDARERQPPPAAIRYGLLNDVEPVMSCDLDLSRRVTHEEFEACARRRFDLLDSNQDGVFELSESERAEDLLRRRRRLARN